MVAPAFKKKQKMILLQNFSFLQIYKNLSKYNFECLFQNVQNNKNL